MKIRSELVGRDYIEAEVLGDVPTGELKTIRIFGCASFMDMMQGMRKNFGLDVRKWPLPAGTDHASLLLRETILKLRGEWHFPDVTEEICHCRSVSAKTIDEAVISGAHSTAKVSRLTNASTNCGTCRPDVQKIIDYRLQKSN